MSGVIENKLLENAAFDEEIIDLRQYWQVIVRHKVSIIGLTFLITLLTALIVFSMDPIYRSTATVMIQSNDAKVVSIEQVYGLDGGNTEFYQTQFEILRSRALAEKIIEKFNLRHHAEYAPEKQEPLLGFSLKDLIPEGLISESGETSEDIIHDGVVEALRSKVSIEPVRKSQIVRISFESKDQLLAAAVPNALADFYIESDLDARMQMTRKAADWLTGRLDGLRLNLEQSEEALQGYRDRSGLIDIQGVEASAAKQLDELTGRIFEARRLRASAENIYNQVQRLSGSSIDKLESVPAILSHPLIQTLKESENDIERKLSELGRRYGPKHPNMIATQSEFKAAKANTHKQIRRIISGIKKEYDVARANERAVERELENSKNEARGINKKEYKLRILERDVDSNRQLYDMFLTRFKETNVSDDMQSTIARIVDPSVVSYIAHKPKKKLIVGIALVLGLFLSVLLAFLLEYLDATFKSVEDVEKRLGMTVLGILPLLKQVTEDRALKTHFVENGKSNYSESIRTIRTGVMLSGLDNPHKIILVTSSVPSEGKSSLSCNLAMAVGQMEKVLLIDADMRRPTIGRTFGFNPATPGLSNLVAGTETLEQCINSLDGTGIDVMTSGIVPPNPLELLSSKKFEQILISLSEKYDRVIIDSAPTQAVSDSIMLSRYASAVIYVVKSDETPYHVAEQGIKRMHEVKAPLLGVVLNKVDVSKSQGYYGKYGYYGYGQGYGTQDS